MDHVMTYQNQEFKRKTIIYQNFLTLKVNHPKKKLSRMKQTQTKRKSSITLGAVKKFRQADFVTKVI